MTLVLESYPACGDVAGPVEYAVGRLEGIQRIVFRFPDARDEDRCPQYAGADVADSGKVELLIYPDEPLPEVWPRNNQ